MGLYRGTPRITRAVIEDAPHAQSRKQRREAEQEQAAFGYAERLKLSCRLWEMSVLSGLSRYSCRRAATGSIRDARRAGA